MTAQKRNQAMTAKFRLLLVPALIALLVAGCEKAEGLYSAKKKIAEVYITRTGTYMSQNEETGAWEDVDYAEPRYKSEEWTWDRSKLYSIKYAFRDGYSAGTDAFTYDGGLLVEKQNRANSSKTVFSYQGKELQTIEFYMDGSLYSSTYLKHKDGKIVEATTTFYSMKKHVAPRSLEGVLLFAPYTAYRLSNAKAADASQDELLSERIEIEWTGDNITAITSYYDGKAQGWWSFTYDNKKNPMRNFWAKSELSCVSVPLYGSENNLITAKMVYVGETLESYSYSYDYQGSDYPATCTCTMQKKQGNLYPVEETTTTEYIYK